MFGESLSRCFTNSLPSYKDFQNSTVNNSELFRWSTQSQRSKEMGRKENIKSLRGTHTTKTGW